jgi:hypothetical protein
MPSFSDLLANNPYDGDPLDGSEVIAVLEDDEGLLEGITTQQLANLLPYDWSALTSYDGDPLDGTETLPIYEDDEGQTEAIETSDLLDYDGPVDVTNDLAVQKATTDQKVRLAFFGQGNRAGLEFTRSDGTYINSIRSAGVNGNDLAINPRFGTVFLSNGTEVARVDENGDFTANSKSFFIDHPNPEKADTHTLQHGSLEGPEHAVYQRGILNGSAVIDLPSYWPHLIDEATITVNLTTVGGFQKLYVKSKGADQIKVGIDGGSASDIHCDYTVYGERKDVDSLTAEEEK